MEEYIKSLFKNSQIQKAYYKNYLNVFQQIFASNQSLEFAKEVLDIIINNCLNDVVDYDSMINDFLITFDDDDTYNALYEYIDKRFYDIANNLNAASLTIYKSDIPRRKKIIGEVLDKNFDKNIEEIIKYRIFSILSINNYDDIDIYFIKNIFKDLLEYEQKKLSDIIFDASGVYSCVHIIGDKVFKMGKRKTFRIENDKRYLKPVLRSQIKIGNQKLCFEITERVSLDVSNKDLKMIVNELEKKGKYWDDQGINNIGRLIKPNKVYYKYPILDDTGYIETPESNIILPAGEIVIIDNDYMYDNEKQFTKKY